MSTIGPWRAIDAKDQITPDTSKSSDLRVDSRRHGSRGSSNCAIEAAALLHDMGKLAVPVTSQMPGPLNYQPNLRRWLHASEGDILSQSTSHPVVPIVRHHHEVGMDSLSRQDLRPGHSIGARDLSVVDCFDASRLIDLIDHAPTKRLFASFTSDVEQMTLLLLTRLRRYTAIACARIATPLGFVKTSPCFRAPAACHRSRAVLCSTRSPRARTRCSHSSIWRGRRRRAWESRRNRVDRKTSRGLPVPSSACVFYIYDEDADELVAAHTSGEHAAHIKGLRVPIGQRLSGWVAANRQTIRNSDPVLDLGESARAMNPRPRSCLSTPLLSGKTLVGVLSLYSSNKEAYSEDHERIIEVVARQVSAAILEAQDAERLRKRSFKDESTGLPNLRHLIEFVEAQLAGDDERRHAFA